LREPDRQRRNISALLVRQITDILQQVQTAFHMHPSEVLFQGKHQPVSIPACDHYAGSEKLMRKSIALQQERGPVFDITLDCEDGAAAGNEENHARLVAQIVTGKDNRFGRIGARVHDINSAFFEKDVEIICQGAGACLAYLVIPKVESAAEVADAATFIARHAEQGGRDRLPIHVLIETHGALNDVRAIAAHPQVECLSFGIMDFISSHYGAIPADAIQSPGQFSHPLVTRAKLEISAACHAHGKVPSHNVTTEIRDAVAAGHDARRAMAEFGYARMWSIHPGQIDPILSAFSPCSDEVDEAAQILAQAQANDWGPIQHHGKLHDRASYRYYWTILQRAKRNGMTLSKTISNLL
jgi:citrate lyase subunit beta/citryl-CoA lyase